MKNQKAAKRKTASERIRSREKRLEEARQMNLLSNTFMSVALKDIPACQHVLRILLGRPDLTIREVRTRYHIARLASHDAELDVIAEDRNAALYVTEIQRSSRPDHPRRIRFYGAMADNEFLEKGQNYSGMPETFVVYISEKDFWKGEAAAYSVAKSLVPKREMTETGESTSAGRPYDDGFHVLYVNAAVDDGSEIAKLMKYFKTADPNDMSQGALSRRVHFLKCEKGGEKELCEISERWRQEDLEEGRREGRKEGRKDIAREASVRLYRKGMPLEEIAEVVQFSPAMVRRWVGESVV